MFRASEYALAAFGAAAVAVGIFYAQPARCQGSDCVFLLCKVDGDCPPSAQGERQCICTLEEADKQGICFPLGPALPPPPEGDELDKRLPPAAPLEPGDEKPNDPNRIT